MKDRTVNGEIYPLTNAFVVDVRVQEFDGEPKTTCHRVHDVAPLRTRVNRVGLVYLFIVSSARVASATEVSGRVVNVEDATPCGFATT